MSLRGFHKFFITAAVLMTAMFALWVFFLAPEELAKLSLTVSGVVSALISVGLVVYGVTFLKKTRQFES
jgi:membrane protein implicated in regulation of membrane protease activity